MADRRDALAHQLDLLRRIPTALEERRADDADVDAVATHDLGRAVVDAAVDVDEAAAAGRARGAPRASAILGASSGMKPWPPQPGSTVMIMMTSSTVRPIGHRLRPASPG